VANERVCSVDPRTTRDGNDGPSVDDAAGVRAVRVDARHASAGGYSLAQQLGYGISEVGAIGSGLGAGLVFLCLMIECGMHAGRLRRCAGLCECGFCGPKAGRVTEIVVVLTFLGIGWGMITGAAGGIFFFGFGAIFGMLFAIPIGAAAVLVFGVVHRLLERGGMIERRHFLPIASAIIGIVSALALASRSSDRAVLGSVGRNYAATIFLVELSIPGTEPRTVQA